VSYKDVNPTVGQYGSVVTGAVGGHHCLPLLASEPQTDSSLWQIYSLTRLSMLMAVIMYMIQIRVICQVCLVLCDCLPISKRLRPKGLDHHQFCGHTILPFTSVPDDLLILSFFQIFAYVTFASSSLLMILRV